MNINNVNAASIYEQPEPEAQRAMSRVGKG
jgi:hypothetical protein